MYYNAALHDSLRNHSVLQATRVQLSNARMRFVQRQLKEAMDEAAASRSLAAAHSAFARPHLPPLMSLQAFKCLI